jgi:hypothetical protein
MGVVGFGWNQILSMIATTATNRAKMERIREILSKSAIFHCMENIYDGLYVCMIVWMYKYIHII